MRSSCLALCLAVALALCVEGASAVAKPAGSAAAIAKKKKCKRGYARNKRGRCVRHKAKAAPKTGTTTTTTSPSLSPSGSATPTTPSASGTPGAGAPADATAEFTQLLTGAKLYRVYATTTAAQGNDGYSFCPGGRLAYHSAFVGYLGNVSVTDWQGTWGVVRATTRGDLLEGLVNYAPTAPAGPGGQLIIDIYRSSQQAFMGTTPGQGLEFQRLPGLALGC